MTPLHYVAGAGLFELTRRLLAKDVNIDAETSFFQRALDLAAGLRDKKQQISISTMLLEKGAELTADGDEIFGESPFISMLYNSPSGPMIELFLAHNVDIQGRDSSQFNALHNLAISGDDPALVQLLVDAEAEVNAEDGDGETPLHKLVRREDCKADMVEAFLKAGAQVNKDDKYSQQPLAVVCATQNADIVKTLLQHGANVHDTDDWGLTALHKAAQRSNPAVIDLLLKHGSDPTTTDNEGRTPFWMAAATGNVDILKMFVESLCTQCLPVVDTPDKHGRTPLRKACASGKLEAARFLLDLREKDIEIDINTKDARLERTALHAAAYRGLTEIIELLIQSEANRTSADKFNKTPLQLACQGWSRLPEQHNLYKRSTAALQLLIENDREAAAEDIGLLHIAAIKGSMEVLKALLRAGANPNALDEHGWTAVDHAKQYARDEAYQLLRTREGIYGQRPTKWVQHRSNRLLVSDDGTEIRQNDKSRPGYEDAWLTIFSDHPVPSGTSRYYYEVEMGISESTPPLTNPVLGIGMAHGGLTKRSKPLQIPGLPAYSATDNIWGYHGDDGNTADSLGWVNRIFQEPYGPGDVVGCAVDFSEGRLFFTKNGEVLTQKIFSNVRGRLHCAIGMGDPVRVKTRFEPPFKWAPGDTEDWIGFEGYPDKNNTVEKEKGP